MAQPTFEDLRALADMRAADAGVLFDAGRHSGAYYLAGYAVECGLKAIIAQSFRSGVIPDKALVNKIHTHDLVALVGLAGLRQALEQRSRSPAFAANWSIVGVWSESARYDMIDPFRSTEMLKAVRDSESGVLEWLRAHW